VILSIGLGITAYYGFDGQQALADQKKEAETKQKASDKARSWESYKALLLKAYAGHAAKEDLESLADLRGKYDKGAFGKGEKDEQEIADLTKKLDTDFGWDKTNSKPLNTYKDKVATLTAQLAKAEDTLAKEKASTATALAQMEQVRLAKDAENDKLKEQLAKAQKETADEKARKLEAVTVRDETIQKYQGEIDTTKKSGADKQKEFDANIAKRDKQVQQQDAVIQKMRDKDKPRSILDFESPRGKITSIDRRGANAFINLGSADRVKPQLTFSIFRSGGGLSDGRERKGAVEVVRVLGDHFSMARITEVQDAGREPILPGDVVYNPSWNPNARTRVAIAGLIDLSGDGRDNTAEFIRALEKQGIVVDEYLDLKDLAFKGPGLSLQTNYLIMGESPQITSLGLREGDTRTDRLQEILKKMGEKNTEALKLGITVVPARRFMSLIGLQMPNNPRPPDYNARPTSVLAPGAAKAPAAEDKGDAAPAAEEKPEKPAAKPKEKPEDKPKEKPAPKAKPDKPAKEEMEKDDKGKNDKDKDAK